MALKSIDAPTAAKLKEKGALMVDVREPGEFARMRIPGSQNIPLSRFETSALPVTEGQEVVFFCASGNRTAVHAARLAAKASGAKASVMVGGISAWGMHGLPLEQGGSDAGGGRGFFSRMFG